MKKEIIKDLVKLKEKIFPLYSSCFPAFLFLNINKEKILSSPIEENVEVKEINFREEKNIEEKWKEINNELKIKVKRTTVLILCNIEHDRRLSNLLLEIFDSQQNKLETKDVNSFLILVVSEKKYIKNLSSPVVSRLEWMNSEGKEQKNFLIDRNFEVIFFLSLFFNFLFFLSIKKILLISNLFREI